MKQSRIILVWWVAFRTGAVILCLAGFALNGAPVGKKKRKTGFSYFRKNVVFVRLGEIIVVQKNKGSVRIRAADVGFLRRTTDRDIREYFLRKKQRLEIVNRSGSRIGSFHTRRAVIERGILPGKSRSIILFGILELKDAKHRGTILGFHVGFNKVHAGYLPPVHEPTPRRPIRRIRHATDGKLMVYIPTSRLVYGQGHDAEEDNFNPYFRQRDAWVMPRINAYYIDQYETTNREYLRFCLRSGHPLPPSWKNGRYAKGHGDHPMEAASYEDARAYARWAGKRLPTEREWELAARGSIALLIARDGRRGFFSNPPVYPIGDTFDARKCNTRESGRGASQSVFSLNDKSPFGIFGMCGNAREWTSSWYQAYPGSRLRRRDAHLAGHQFKVIRGGSYRLSGTHARADARDYGGFPNLREDRSAGFRLVVDVR